MRLLVLGGTRFLGRHLVEAALARGHAVTLFHRGRTARGMFAAAEERLGERDGGLAALAGGRWDAAVDTSGYLPRLVADSARALVASVDRYLFVSTVSVYAEPVRPGYDESAPLQGLADPATEQVTGETYGGLKALCEAVVRDVFGERATVVRPGLIVGPHDTTDRFPYWPRRLARGGVVLAPGAPGQPVSCVDARDLAAWMLQLVEQDLGGTMHATGHLLPMSEFLARAATAVGGTPEYAWLTEEFLLAQGVQPWLGLPLWVPAADAGFSEADQSRARAAGLRLCDLETTVADTLAWERTLPAGHRDGSPTLTAAREAELVAQWRAGVGG
jgi:2'-hydroxyisoflavone reductase